MAGRRCKQPKITSRILRSEEVTMNDLACKTAQTRYDYYLRAAYTNLTPNKQMKEENVTSEDFVPWVSSVYQAWWCRLFFSAFDYFPGVKSPSPFQASANSNAYYIPIFRVIRLVFELYLRLEYSHVIYMQTRVPKQVSVDRLQPSHLVRMNRCWGCCTDPLTTE